MAKRGKYIAAVGLEGILVTKKQFAKWKKGFEKDIVKIGSVDFVFSKVPWYWILPSPKETILMKMLRRSAI